MSNLALGLIETVGLAAAIEAADAAVKSANVRLIGYELTKGDGMVTVKIEGDVGSVKAGTDSAVAAVSRNGKVYSVSVIPRPAEGLDKIVLTKETVGRDKEEPAAQNLAEEIPQEPVGEAQPEPPAPGDIKAEAPQDTVIAETEVQETAPEESGDTQNKEADENNGEAPVFEVTSGAEETAEPEAQADTSDEKSSDVKPSKRRKKK